MGELTTPIFVRLEPSENGVFYLQSHRIKTPDQEGPYVTSRPWGDTAGYALRLAVSGITQYYRSAVRAGHKPSEDWLVADASM